MELPKQQKRLKKLREKSMTQKMLLVNEFNSYADSL